MKISLRVALGVAVIAAAWSLQVAEAQQPATTRTEVQRHDLSVAGREVVQARVEVAGGALAARHSHPGEEIAYVLAGALEYRIDGKPPVTLGAGQSLFIPAGAVHSAKNLGAGPAVELATYFVEKGKPLVVTAR